MYELIKQALSWTAIGVVSLWGSLLLLLFIDEVYQTLKRFFTPEEVVVPHARLAGEVHVPPVDRDLYAGYAGYVANNYLVHRYYQDANGRVWLRDANDIFHDVSRQTTKEDYYKIPKRNIPGWL